MNLFLYVFLNGIVVVLACMLVTGMLNPTVERLGHLIVRTCSREGAVAVFEWVGDTFFKVFIGLAIATSPVWVPAWRAWLWACDLFDDRVIKPYGRYAPSACFSALGLAVIYASVTQ